MPSRWLDQPQDIDFYKVLAVARTASNEEIKSAYHSALIKHHPDKNTTKQVAIHITTIKEAYEVLSTPALRALYDKKLLQTTATAGWRPAQSVSLEDFEEDPMDETAWTYPCRCGSSYRITENNMDNGIHLIECNGCSELVWVGFELAKSV
ncbi:DnaJ domain-containing protein [Lentinula raphanica]|nr:DnaJ domain-containing protein [Lentinula raphanica]